MLILPIKKKWFDMIISGEKKEEYREMKPYYKTRIQNELKVLDSFGQFGKCWHIYKEIDLDEVLSDPNRQYYVEVLFRNGYSNNSPSFKAMCSVKIAKGNPNWGAEPNTLYYVLTPEMKDILKTYDEVEIYDNQNNLVDVINDVQAISKDAAERIGLNEYFERNDTPDDYKSIYYASVPEKTIVLTDRLIGEENVSRALNVLIDNGIDANEAKVVLQAIGYTLLDTELDSLIWPTAETFIWPATENITVKKE